MQIKQSSSNSILKDVNLTLLIVIRLKGTYCRVFWIWRAFGSFANAKNIAPAEMRDVEPRHARSSRQIGTCRWRCNVEMSPFSSNFGSQYLRFLLFGISWIFWTPILRVMIWKFLIGYVPAWFCRYIFWSIIPHYFLNFQTATTWRKMGGLCSRREDFS